MNEYEIPKSKPRSILKLVAVVLLVIGLVLVIYYLTKVNKAASSESREVSVLIQKGFGTKQIAYQLQADRVISSPWIFIIYSSLNSAENKFQAGQYVLNANMPIPEIVDILTHGKVVSNARMLTIVEGWNNKQIASYLHDRQITNFESTLASDSFNFKYEDLGKKFSYEGFLFPDTYKLSLDGTVDQLISKMLANFETKISEQMLADIKLQNKDLGQILILASIIEKEVGRNKPSLTAQDLANMNSERRMVASVFYNRLEIGMALESDATVNYVTGKGDRQVSLADTKVKSAYNTYLNRGLPPSPICNPGLDAINAAIYPAKSDYLYFINASDGTAYFAKTLAEHNANKVKYLK